jgi:hypothetical protein
MLDGALHQSLGSTQKSLTILETLAARVQTPVDDVHAALAPSLEPHPDRHRDALETI